MQGWQEGPGPGLLALVGLLVVLAAFVVVGFRWVEHERAGVTPTAPRAAPARPASREYTPAPAAEAAGRIAQQPTQVLRDLKLKPLALFPFLGRAAGASDTAGGKWVAVDLIAEHRRPPGEAFRGLQVEHFLLTDPDTGEENQPLDLVPLELDGKPSAQPPFTLSPSRVLLLYHVSEMLRRAEFSYWPEKLGDLILQPADSPAALRSRELTGLKAR